jgi:hypothetical protein
MNDLNTIMECTNINYENKVFILFYFISIAMFIPMKTHIFLQIVVCNLLLIVLYAAYPWVPFSNVVYIYALNILIYR